jgi:endoglucanase
MHKALITLMASLLVCGSISAQSDAARRAATMGVGMNLSYLDNFWLGKRDKHYSDFAKPEAAAKREKMLADIAKAGFKTVRIPICFGAWASIGQPYHWENTQGLELADRFVQWASDNNLNVIIDLHHTEFDGKMDGAATTDRVVWLWKQIAERYKFTDPERVLFEVRNEPHDIKPEDWRAQARAIIAAIRAIDTKHTLIVGFHDWNSRQAMIDSKPFDDPNIIYTFHYYDPFVFTHQGATWTAKGMAETHPVPFPGKASDIKIADSAKGTWVEAQIMKYGDDSRAEKMFADLKAAKDWSERNRVPIFLGEFGSYSKYPTLQDRCRHAAAVYTALGRLNIPNTWWEWDGGFNMFDAGTTHIADCMRHAIDLYYKS